MKTCVTFHHIWIKDEAPRAMMTKCEERIRQADMSPTPPDHWGDIQWYRRLWEKRNERYVPGIEAWCELWPAIPVNNTASPVQPWRPSGHNLSRLWRKYHCDRLSIIQHYNYTIMAILKT